MDLDKIDKPMDCVLCKRDATIVYKEIKDGKCSSCKMCAVCPRLMMKLGRDQINHPSSSKHILDQECPFCRTKLSVLKIENRVGCAHCYEVFQEHLTEELAKTHTIPVDATSTIVLAKNAPLHFGAAPERRLDKNAHEKLKFLHQALGDALHLENYELAASLRDQIKRLEASDGQERQAS